MVQKQRKKLDLDLDNTAAATFKTVKLVSGNDTLTVAINVAAGTTINLGAGNDKLVAGATGSVVTWCYNSYRWWSWNRFT